MTEINEMTIREALGNVIDPDIEKSLAEMDAIEKIEIEGNLIRVYLKLVQPIHWVAERINNSCVEALKEIAPDYENEILVAEIPGEEAKRELLNGVKNIIAVSSGKGGVGKSAIASNLAAALSLKGARVGILDGDVYGPSQPTMFGLKDEKLVAKETPEGGTVAYPLEKYGIKVASMGFVMEKEQAAIVRGPMLASYFSMLFEQLDWGPLDFLIFDLPPGTGDIQLTLTQKIPLTGAVIVTTPQEISIADVRRSIAMFEKVNVDILGIVENMSYFVPPDMPEKKYYIFGEGGGKTIADESGVSLLGQVPLDINMREGNDGGMPVVLNENAGLQGQVLRDISAEMVAQVRKLNYSGNGATVQISM
jgi:ATP-binding protein involved in chromosome partitioning